MSAKGMTSQVRTRSGVPPHTLWFHKMTGISLATMGRNVTAGWVCYVAKSLLHSGGSERAIYVFDAGELSREVLATLGQSFNLAVAVARGQREHIRLKAHAVAPKGGPGAGAGAGVPPPVPTSARPLSMAATPNAAYELGSAPQEVEYELGAEPSSLVAYDVGDLGGSHDSGAYENPPGAYDQDDMGVYESLDVHQLLQHLNGKDKVRRRASLAKIKVASGGGGDEPAYDIGSGGDGGGESVAYEEPVARRPTWVHLEGVDENFMQEGNIEDVLASLEGMDLYDNPGF